MTLPTRRLAGICGLTMLLFTVQVASCLRRNDWGEMLDPHGWLWALTPTVFMGSWGWITLIMSKRIASNSVSLGLVALAVIYFAVMAWLTADIILTGNSTAGIAFFVIPIVSSIVMLPVFVLSLWVDSKFVEKSIDRQP